MYVGLASTWILLAGMLWSTPRGSSVGFSENVAAWTYLVNQAEVICRYLRLSIWRPIDLVVDYGLPRALALHDVLPQALALIALLIAACVALVRWRAIGFLGVSFFLLLAPTSSVIPITTEVGADRRMYLPFAALAVLAVTAGRVCLNRVNSLLKNNRCLTRLVRVTTGAVVVAILLLLTTLTIARNAEYHNALTLWRADVERRPHGRSRMALAGELVGAGDHAQATALLRDAVADFPDARVPLGAELILQQQEFEEGISVLQQFLADGTSKPKRRAAHTLLAQAFESEGKLDQAANEWRAVLADAPGDAAASTKLAQILATKAPQGAAIHTPTPPDERTAR